MARTAGSHPTMSARVGRRVVSWMVVALVVAACGAQEQSPSPSDQASPTPSPTAAPVRTADLAKVVVQVVSTFDEGTQALGSGSLISSDGLVLTNAHVITPEEGDGDLVDIEIGLTEESDAPPEPTYRAEVAAADGALDLAVLRITERLDGEELEAEFSFASIGDSDALDIGDPLRILGYPGIGGETITLTTGEVSGFVSEAGLGRRAWIKTDATIAGGNSGGLAANADGELVAIPTIAGTGGEEVVDCRPVRDTNRDGSVDDADDCVPIGGFLNGLRPIALALDMIDAVRDGVAYEPIAPAVPVADGGSIEDVVWSDPVFGSGVDARDEPVGEGIAFETSITSLCAVWDYEEMASGLRWSAEWWVNGELDREASFLDERWTLDEAGRFWVCLDDEEGMEAGVYDIALLVEDEVFSTGSVHVGDALATTTVSFTNDSTETICYLFATPARSTVWGVERLGTKRVIDPGDTVTIDLVADDYDVYAEDCDLTALFEEPAVISGETAQLAWTGESLTGSGASSGALAVGDCIDGEVGWNRRTSDLVPCDEPHTRQIVGIVASEDGEFPGDSALEALADAHCYDAFEQFIGISYERSEYYMTSWYPSAETWEVGDRHVVCTAELEDESPFTGTLEGSGR